MSLNVVIEKDAQVLKTIDEPLSSLDGIAALLAVLKSAKTQTNEFLSELVDAEKASPATTILTPAAKLNKTSDGRNG